MDDEKYIVRVSLSVNPKDVSEADVFVQDLQTLKKPQESKKKLLGNAVVVCVRSHKLYSGSQLTMYKNWGLLNWDSKSILSSIVTRF